MRMICIDGVCSRLVQASRGITAGAGMATSELRLFMLDLILSSTKLFSWVKHTLYVDDLTLEAVGEVQVAPRLLAKASDFAVHYLESKLLAEVSPTKTVFLTRSKRSREAFRGHLRTKKIKFAKTSKLLGVQTVAGRGRSTAVLRNRLTAFRKKIPRIQRLRAAGINVQQVTAAVGVPAFYYGAHCSGIADAHLESSRKAVAKAVGTATQGKQYDRSLYMHDITGSRLDPAFDAHALPLQYLALAWWEKWTDPRRLAAQFTTAWYKLAAQAWNWRGVTGPMSAAIATAHRIEWRFTSPHTVLTDQDSLIDLTRDSPAAIVKQVHASVRRWQFAKVLRQLPRMVSQIPAAYYNGATINSRLLPPGIVADSRALASLLGSKRGVPKELKELWCKENRPWLHSTAAGAQWPQARVASVPGWSDDSSCQLCGATPGNLLHRSVCPANVPHGGWPAPTKEAQAGLDRLSAEQRAILFSTGLMAINIPIPAPPADEDVTWLVPVPRDSSPHLLKWYIDGSLIDPQTPFQRVGAGMVALDNGIPVALATATPPPWIDTIPGAEAWALYAVLSMCFQLPRINTDCLGNRKTLLDGMEAATAASRPLARVWAAIFTCCEGALVSQLDEMLTWGPAHTSLATLGTRLKSDGRPLTAEDWRANNIADAAAKIAARRHRAPTVIRQRLLQLRAAQRYGAAVAGTACKEANNHRTMMVNEQGEVSTVVRRDSIGKQCTFSAHDGNDGSTTPLDDNALSKTAAKAATGPETDFEAYLPPDFPLADQAMSLHMAAQVSERRYHCDDAGTGYRTPARSKPRMTRAAANRVTSKPRQSHGVTRATAVQAAAFANRIDDMAKLPAPPFTADTPVTPEQLRLAASLSSAAHQASDGADACAAQPPIVTAPSHTSASCDSQSAKYTNRRSFIEQLTSAARRMTGGTLDARAAASTNYEEDGPSLPCSRVPTQRGNRSLPANATHHDMLSGAIAVSSAVSSFFFWNTATAATALLWPWVQFLVYCVVAG